MSKPLDDGGPAFSGQPIFHTPHGAISADVPDGMTLRDWFAGQALAGVITLCAGDTVRSGTIAEHMARRAYQMADAMIDARARRSEPEGE